jgi:dTDP-4-amino-4,6-dideoxygalactose transaminase
MLRDHGSVGRYRHEDVGVNGRLDEMQAAVLRLKLPFLDEWNSARLRHARHYTSVLAGLPVETPDIPGSGHVFHLYVIRTPDRDALREYLSRRGIHTGIHYPIPCHLQPACSQFSKGEGSLPVTEAAAGEILSLPMFPELREDEIERIAAALTAFFAGRDNGDPQLTVA